MRHDDKLGTPRQGIKLGAHAHYSDALGGAKGRFLIEMKDARTGEVLHYEEKDNVITKDGGILAAICFASGTTGAPGISMLSVGTGATGPLLNPDAPTNNQRKLNSELSRKAFSSVTFRTAAGVASTTGPTNIVDFTTTFNESEAVGPLNEMGLIRPLNPGGAPAVPNLNGGNPFPFYDATVNVTLCDVLVNYLTFAVISKPSTAILTITWRLTF